jgi:hypothetical protein
MLPVLPSVHTWQGRGHGLSQGEERITGTHRLGVTREERGGDVHGTKVVAVYGCFGFR